MTQVLELAFNQQDSSLGITVLHDLGAFPQWTMDACLTSHQLPSVTAADSAIIGLSNNSIQAFSCARDGQGAAQQLWTAACTEELLLYSMAIHMANTVPESPVQTLKLAQLPNYNPCSTTDVSRA